LPLPVRPQLLLRLLPSRGSPAFLVWAVHQRQQMELLTQLLPLLLLLVSAAGLAAAAAVAVAAVVLRHPPLPQHPLYT
jgi:hypothetical protein